MNTPLMFNYELRPCKFVERRMFIMSLSRVIARFGGDYQYVGFGGLTFTDFKLFHKELNIDRMLSIEAGADITDERLEFNKPYSSIVIKRGLSTDQLTQIDFSKKTIVWLDYDEPLKEYYFEDISIVLGKFVAGSVIAISCNTKLLKKKDQPYTDEEFRSLFDVYIPADIEDNCCNGKNAATTLMRMFRQSCESTINERNQALTDKLKFRPLYYFTYNDKTPMMTFGGIVLPEQFDDADLNFDGLNFIGEEKFDIDVPILTMRETIRLNQVLHDNAREESDIISLNILDREGIDKYKELYKYMPNYFDVRL